ncbi:MAG: phosphohistidine phosphatase SixA [Ignavibacteria bacterium]|nr:phosphohistidine phosphatase SixA [Ignavibacteria bacterium]
MKIYLIRHGEAIDHETNSVKSDEYRFLTVKGRMTTRKVAKNLKDELSLADKIFTSPLTRAVQTAEIIATTIKFKNDVEIVNELKIGSSISKIIELITEHSAMNVIVLVGHEPMMGMLVHALSDKKDFYNFKKSGVCLIDFDVKKEQGAYKWFLNPKTLEHID